MAKIVKIAAFKEQYRITLPKVLVQIKNWKPGTKLAITQLPDGSINLKEAEETIENENQSKKQKE
ncbi:AbrB/MazE/SpoVT family DNA-binding domain-containing protein [Candidatus Woesearchaeota archaeon]|nr:AbrB/MazE/SpoVT family DNA-binding domain-containing protein [Candidatus Woesearchaeota archaeon]